MVINCGSVASGNVLGMRGHWSPVSPLACLASEAFVPIRAMAGHRLGPIGASLGARALDINSQIGPTCRDGVPPEDLGTAVGLRRSGKDRPDRPRASSEDTPQTFHGDDEARFLKGTLLVQVDPGCLSALGRVGHGGLEFVLSSRTPWVSGI